MKKYVLLVILFLLLVACNNEEQVIVKEKSSPQSSKENPELVEQSDEDEVDEMIEFILPNEKVMINLEMVPILNAFLSAANDRSKAVESMDLTPVHYDQSHLYILEFSCVNESCSYLLLDKSEGNQAYLVADLAQLKEIKLSPDNSKILLLFNRGLSTAVPLSNLVVVDIENWELLSLKNMTNEVTVLDYQWPILVAEWTDNQHISITIPSIEKPTNDALTNWNKTNGPTQQITFTTK